MQPVEVLCNRRQIVPCQRASLHRNGQFVGLPDVPHVGGADEHHRRPGKSLPAELFRALCLHVVEDRLDPVHVRVPGHRDVGLHIVVSHVRGEHADGGGDPRMGRHHDLLHVQRLGKLHSVHRAGSPKGDENELTRVVASLYGNPSDSPDHVRIHHREDALRRLVQADAQGTGDPLLQDPGRLVQVEGHLAAEKAGRAEPAQDEVRIGHRRLRAPAPVADRARVRAGAFRSHPKSASRVDAGDASPARSDRVDVDHGQLDRIASDLAFGRQPRRPALDQADVRARAPHVDGDDVRTLDGPGDEDPGQRPPCRAGQDGPGTHAAGRSGRDDPAVRLHDVEVRGDAHVLHLSLQVCHIVAHLGHDIGIDAHGARSLVLPELGEHVGRDRHVCLGNHLGEDRCDASFVDRVGVGVQQRDRDGPDPLLSDLLGDLPGLHLVKGPEHFAGVQHPFRDAEAQVTGHDRGRPSGPEIVESRPVLSPDVQYVFEALCGQQCDPGALVLQEGVGCDRCSVDEEAELFRRESLLSRSASGCRSRRQGRGWTGWREPS